MIASGNGDDVDDVIPVEKTGDGKNDVRIVLGPPLNRLAGDARQYHIWMWCC